MAARPATTKVAATCVSAIAVIVLVVMACSPAGTPSPTLAPGAASLTATPTPKPVAAPTHAPTPRPLATPTPSRCLEVPAAAVGALATGLKGGTRLANVQAVKSSDFANAFFVSAYINGPGIAPNSVTGTWVTNRIDGSAGFFSVDGFAREFSDWADGTKTTAQFSMTNDGARQSQGCVRAP